MTLQTIFRAYDIRGIYPEELSSEGAFNIGQAFAVFLSEKTGLGSPRVVVGRDNRTHGEILQQAFIRGLLDQGCSVTDIGLSPTPLLYFSVVSGEFDAGCNVSASHNPPEYNGFKLIGRDAHAICGEDLQTLYRLTKKVKSLPKKEVGSLQLSQFFNRYGDKIKTLFPPKKQLLKVVIDTGNGVAGAFYPQLIEQLGYSVIPLYTELNGSFPNHPPDPIVENNLADLKKTVLKEGADLGIAFDGDGDRLGIVDENGRHWNSDVLALLFARDVLKRHPGSAMVFTVANSQALFDQAAAWGGKPHMCKVGHPYVEAAMIQTGAILGGEQSGHFFLTENYYRYDDALLAACRVLEIITDSQKSASALFKEFPEFTTAPEVRPYCADDVKFQVLDQIKTFFLKHYPKSNTQDGIRIDFSPQLKGFVGIRVSNTSPCLSICMEAKDPSELAQIQTIVFEHLKQYPQIRFS